MANDLILHKCRPSKIKPLKDRFSRLDSLAAQISARIGETVRLELWPGVDRQMLKAFSRIEKRSFWQDLRYRADEFFRRSQQENFRAMIIRGSDGVMIGFIVGYHKKEDPREIYFLDTMALAEGYRKKGLGLLFLPMLPLVREMGYREAYLYCDERDVDGADLVSFYHKFGFQLVGSDPEKGNIMRLPLGEISA